MKILIINSMLYKVEDNKKFKQQNLSNWKNNSEFWMQSKMRHLQDIYDFTGEEIKQLVGHYSFTPELLDFGCGEGWILRLLKEKLIKANYTGLDFNPQFIDNLASQYKSDSTASFSLTDFEEKPAKKLLGKGDIGINVFNFFEIPNLDVAFSNVASMLKEKSHLIIVSIDPIMQILAVSSSEKSFVKNLDLYEKYKTKLGYDKDIDIGDIKSNRVYKSLLYSTDTYVRLAKKSNFKLYDYKEVVKTGNIVPQIYQFIYFKR